MLFVEPAGAAPDVFNRGLEYLFYAAPATADRHGILFAEYILGLPDGERPTTAAYPILDDPFAMATAEGVRTELEANGIETVFTETYPPEQTEFATIAAEIADSGAELVVGGTQFEDAVGLVRGMQELAYQPQAVFMTTGPTIPDFDEAFSLQSAGRSTLITRRTRPLSSRTVRCSMRIRRRTRPTATPWGRSWRRPSRRSDRLRTRRRSATTSARTSSRRWSVPCPSMSVGSRRART
jgi:ABC-type branched-subunit amino acid transport system substrate-binding protein